MRSLSADERALWAKVAATIRPLSRDRVVPSSPEDTVPSAVSAVERKSPAVPRKPVAAPVAPKPRPGTTLDGTWDKRIRTGNLSPDRTLDLHGHSLHSAWRSIDDVLESAIADGARIVLLITGHQRRGEPPVERGKIRAAVHDWLAASRHAPHIAAVRGAHPRHGGGGSLYIILRRS